MKPTTAAIPLLLLLLTWLAFRAANENAELFDTALATVDHFAMQESALQGNVLSARAGVLRNYDPLVREANALDKSLSRLRETAAVDAQASATIDRLTESVGREEALIERVKSDNALLQNSLAYFGLFSARLSASDQTRPIAPAVGGLVSAMLNFTLDTSSDTAREVENRLDELARQPSLPTDAEADAVRGLLAHGRLLHEILPATDNLLKALHAIPQEQDREALRAAVLAQQNISRTTARWFRLALYVTSLLLVAILVRLGLRIRAQSMALHRRAAFEHVIAGISMRFVDARPQDINAVIEQALVDMAECVGADRAYFISSDPSVQSHHWHRKGISFPPDWPDRAAKLTTRFSPSAEGVVHIPYVNWLPPGAHRDACAALGIQGWACVSTPGMGDTHHILGFDAVRGPCRITRAGELSLLPMALDSIANAVRRQIMEQERARLETRLQHARRMETVGALASGIAHNFNNILSAILGYAEMAETQARPDARLAGNLAEIRRAAERARDLIGRILAFGQRREARRHPMSIQSLIAETASLLSATLPPTIELAIHMKTETAFVSGEPAHLQQVLLNLCNNAAQAMDGSGCIEIDTVMREFDRAQPLSHGELAPGCYVCIAVSDAGRGMNDAVLQRIFEPFFTTRPAGNGLGLATALETIREHGGEMHVQSTPGAGSRFEVWLPCSAARVIEPSENLPKLPVGHGETVLIIDEEREQLLRDEDILAALGYEPVGFTEGADALTACRASPDRFDVVVVGHVAPSAALDLARALHAIVPDRPILLATASADEIGADALMAAGISEILGWRFRSTDIAPALFRCLAPLRVSLAP